MKRHEAKYHTELRPPDVPYQLSEDYPANVQDPTNALDPTSQLNWLDPTKVLDPTELLDLNERRRNGINYSRDGIPIKQLLGR